MLRTIWGLCLLQTTFWVSETMIWPSETALWACQKLTRPLRNEGSRSLGVVTPTNTTLPSIPKLPLVVRHASHHPIRRRTLMQTMY